MFWYLVADILELSSIIIVEYECAKVFHSPTNYVSYILAVLANFLVGLINYDLVKTN